MMFRERRGGTTAETNQPTEERALTTSAAVLGFTIGLFAGMSETPVIGVLVSGTLGILSGVLVAWLRPSLPDKEHETQGRTISWRPVSAAVTPLCVAAILGGFIGVELRSGVIRRMLWTEPLASLAPEALQKEGKVISNDKRVKLLLLQQALDSFGVSVEQNNAVVNGFISDLSAANGEEKALDTASEQLLPVRAYMHNSGEVLDTVCEYHYLLTDTATEIQSIITQHGISEPAQISRLQQVKRFLEDLPPEQDLDRLAIDGKDIDRMLYQLEQPELDVVLKHVRSYASASPNDSGEVAAGFGFRSRFSFAH